MTKGYNPRVLIFFVIAGLQLLFLKADTVRGKEMLASRYLAEDGESVISITSERMVLKNREDKILFEGKVTVKRDDMTLKAKSVELKFKPSKKEQGLLGTSPRKRELFTITAFGDVRVVQRDRTIKAEEVVYYKKDDKMVFTGKPYIIEGRNRLKGKKITVYIKDDRLVVEGGEALIHPE